LNVMNQIFFFFSSRRQHTRSKRDWSSDVCSSDLELESELDMNEWEEGNEAEEELQPVDQNEEVDWDEFMENSQHDGEYYGGSSGYSGNEDWRDLPDPYHESLLEELEQQVSLLDFDEDQKLIATQILGSDRKSI